MKIENKTTNCPNCGAPYYHNSCECLYCGTDRYHYPEPEKLHFAPSNFFMECTFTGTEFRHFHGDYQESGSANYNGGSDAASCAAAACMGGCF